MKTLDRLFKTWIILSTAAVVIGWGLFPETVGKSIDQALPENVRAVFMLPGVLIVLWVTLKFIISAVADDTPNRCDDNRLNKR